MIFNLTRVFTDNWKALRDPQKRIAVNEGGTSSSKTFSVIQLLVDLLQHRKKPIIASVVSESLPHLKLGCIRDFFNIMGKDFDLKRWNATEHTYSFNPGVVLEFFSADQPGKARGPRRDILYCNEVNNIPKPVFDELDMRTRRFVFVDFNPVSEFWIHEMKDNQEVAWIHSTYLDAKHVLPAAVVEKIEAKKDRDPYWWNVYGLGLVGSLEGLIHPKFTTIDEMPAEGIEVFGLDFGFTDPCALTWNKITDDTIYSDEMIYESGLTMPDLSNKMEACGLVKRVDEIFGDDARPELIEELFRMGWNIKKTEKGKDSVLTGIQRINQYKQVWTKRSVNGIKEQRNYQYAKDKNGKSLECPAQNGMDHLLDSRRYAIFSTLTQSKTFFGRIAI